MKKKRGLKIYLKKLWLKTFKSKDTGNTEGPKQAEPKKVDNRTYYNKNGKI